ncbi:Y4yA family PLP-dependent enzyme [Brachybacterium muris]|uniref:Y4yA family PLP-dependent enzyme n=1 Tax=Brachybacterium muris TaxID=219301 RepID=UPI00223C4FE2|nr:Y4yA family PLP-dependent enzyme [Brachybacterium muris]MCT2261989.1 Y4yA family PLP-dependent enzyme [Brachybacterium muris]
MTDPALTPEATLREACQGTPPLMARLEPWMHELLADPDTCTELLERYGSPLNVHDFTALARNASELTDVAEDAGVDLRIFVARKANKTLGMVRAAHRAGHGIDVGSERELSQVLEAGMPPQDVVVTAAIKPAPVLRLALESRSMLVLDNLDEVTAARRVAEELVAADAHRDPADAHRAPSDAHRGPADGEPFPVALRLAPEPSDLIPPTRFGERAAAWLDLIDAGGLGEHLRIDGVHFHLHGYDPIARATALGEALELIDALRSRGLARDGAFVDIGGGVPMSYLDDSEQWDAFWAAHDQQEGASHSPVPLTWRGEPLRQVYPYHQTRVRGPWLRTLLEHEITPGTSAAQALRERGVQLRCEPGRSMLDGCGMTLARVIQRTTTSDGIPLVGLEMNRTQCRSTSDDFLLDPILVRAGGAPSKSFEGFLVGAYCIEAELILRRRLAFPQGVAVGDIVAIPNTAGYLMHILESASHQIPLASNVERVEADGVRENGFSASASTDLIERDGIDQVLPTRG